MSLITDKRRAELKGMATSELAEIMKENCPENKGSYLEFLAAHNKSALKEERFRILSDPGLTKSEKAARIGKGVKSLSGDFGLLIKLGAVGLNHSKGTKRKTKRPVAIRYTVEQLEKTMKRFPDWNTIRKEINDNKKIESSFYVGDLTDEFDIQPISQSNAIRIYGIKYTVYDRLCRVMLLAAMEGYVERDRLGSKNHYTLLKKIPLAQYRVRRVYTNIPTELDDDILNELEGLAERHSTRKVFIGLQKMIADGNDFATNKTWIDAVGIGPTALRGHIDDFAELGIISVDYKAVDTWRKISVYTLGEGEIPKKFAELVHKYENG